MMVLSKSYIVLGLVDLTFQGKSIGKVPGWLFKDALVILLLGVGLLFALLVWAKYFRSAKKKKRVKPGVEAEIVYRDSDSEDGSDEGESSSRRRRYKRRYRRRDHRSRNPTLAETGGLPPGRSGESGSAAT